MANTNGKLAALLVKLQERLNRVGKETRQNTDAIATVKDDLRLKVGELQFQGKSQNDSIIRLDKEAADREARQTLRDQNNVQALHNLRDSTQKGFDQVKTDVSSLLRAIQVLNERVGQVESKVALKVGSAIDQSIVNSKLAGVYDVTADLERRVQEMESEIELITAVRVANTAFMMGPRKAPQAIEPARS